MPSSIATTPEVVTLQASSGSGTTAPRPLTSPRSSPRRPPGTSACSSNYPELDRYDPAQAGDLAAAGRERGMA